MIGRKALVQLEICPRNFVEMACLCKQLVSEIEPVFRGKFYDYPVSMAIANEASLIEAWLLFRSRGDR